jgi:hypothetical protein
VRLGATGHEKRFGMFKHVPRGHLEIREKPHLAIVAGSIVVAVGIWFVIYDVSGRVIWLW